MESPLPFASRFLNGFAPDSDRRVEGWKKTYLGLFCSERCGSLLLLNLQPHRDHRAHRASFSLLLLKCSKFNSTAVFKLYRRLCGLILEAKSLAGWSRWSRWMD
jgi:hypothetical protein